MRKAFIRPQARLDLLEIWNYIAADDIDAANRTNEKLRAAVRGLALMPGKGHTRADVPDHRFLFLNVSPYVIAYQYDDTALTVERVVHGRRDFRRLFPRRK